MIFDTSDARLIIGIADGLLSGGRWTLQPNASAKISVPVKTLMKGIQSSSSHSARASWRSYSPHAQSIRSCLFSG